ncbi:MAG: FecR domain-containing protein [Ferruginibacter sp.]|nr:FecR domain-containing protein [Cytophagales bacterium]
MEQKPRTSDDFLADESFQAYALRTDPAAVAHWENWLAQHPEENEAIRQAREFLQSIHPRAETLPESSFQQALRQFETVLRTNPARPTPWWNRRFLPAGHGYWSRAAAVAGLMLFTALAYWGYQSSRLLTYHTNPQERSTIILPDGSVVYLNASSRLKVARQWAPQTPRQVWLDGEAFFDVRHAPAIGSAKFVVYTTQVEVEVLGTRFDVRERGEQTKVVLHSGRVSLRTGSETPAVVMRPGELVEVSEQRDLTRRQVNPNVITRRRVNANVYSAWKDNQFVFDNTSIGEVAELIESDFGYRVVFADRALMNRKLTLRMPNRDLDLLLKMLSESHDLKILRQGEQILIDKK